MRKLNNGKVAPVEAESKDDAYKPADYDVAPAKDEEDPQDAGPGDQTEGNVACSPEVPHSPPLPLPLAATPPPEDAAAAPVPAGILSEETPRAKSPTSKPILAPLGADSPGGD